MANSKGLTKRHSALQKEHYKSHPHRLAKNRLARLKRHIRRNAYDVARKARRGRVISVDQQAINRLKSLTNNA